MGGPKWLNSGKEENKYKAVGIVDKVKILVPIDDKRSYNTPLYSNTSQYYATPLKIDGSIKQLTCYDLESHVKIKEIDWSHNHGVAKEGTPHVHFYVDGVKQKEYSLELSPKEKQLVTKLKNYKVEE